MKTKCEKCGKELQVTSSIIDGGVVTIVEVEEHTCPPKIGADKLSAGKVDVNRLRVTKAKVTVPLA